MKKEKGLVFREPFQQPQQESQGCHMVKMSGSAEVSRDNGPSMVLSQPYLGR